MPTHPRPVPMWGGASVWVGGAGGGEWGGIDLSPIPFHGPDPPSRGWECKGVGGKEGGGLEKGPIATYYLAVGFPSVGRGYDGWPNECALPRSPQPMPPLLGRVRRPWCVGV